LEDENIKLKKIIEQMNQMNEVNQMEATINKSRATILEGMKLFEQTQTKKKKLKIFEPESEEESEEEIEIDNQDEDNVFNDEFLGCF